jgi:type IV pilus assembly protein PilW
MTRTRLPATSRPQRGFTLLELMIAMTISLFILSALAAIVIGASNTSRTRDRASDLQINGRYAIETIRRDLQHAGYLGISSLFFPDQPISTANLPLSPAVTVTNVCDNANVGKLSQRIWGSDDSNPYSATCIPAANYLRGDVLVVRGLDPNSTTGPYSATTVYYKSAYEGGAPFIGPTEPDFTGTNKLPPYVNFPLDESVYYISPYTASATEVPLVPALWRLRLGTGPAMIPELVASGVENMQIRYGVFQTNNTVSYLTANNVPASDWDLIRAVEVTLLMRGATPEPDYQNNTTYDLSGTSYAVNDSYPRLVLSAVMQQRN